MRFKKINSFSDFCTALRSAGFSMGGKSDEGVFSLATFFSENVKVHTGDFETDPWEWRYRAISECYDIAYSKLFCNKDGWISKEWYPYFLSLRRDGQSFNEFYKHIHRVDNYKGTLLFRLYDLISKTPNIALHEIKRILRLVKSQSAELQAALDMLQMKMYITVSGSKRKISRFGKQYGRGVITFSTVEDFFGEEFCRNSALIEKGEAIKKITEQILLLNPNACRFHIQRFIGAN